MQSTTDIWFTAFLDSKGIKISKYDVVRRGKGIFYFDLPDQEWRELKLEFSKSSECRYKECVEKIKDLAF